MPFFLVAGLLLASLTFAAVDQEQPTPYDLIRPIWPMKWDTAATDNGGTVESFSKYTPNPRKHNTVPPVGSMPQDFVPNGIIPDSLNQAFRDAQNLRIGRIRINQAGYLPEDPEKQFYYVSAGNCSEKFSVVDLEGNEVFTGGTFTNSGKSTGSSWDIKAGTDAATNNQGRYTAKAIGPEGKVCIGQLSQAAGLDMNKRYRVKVLSQYSATFIISDKVYSMVRDATLKFYGINRSGNSESWFHKPSHTKDGSGKFVKGVGAVTGFTPEEGALQGGWYDCGDHLKESQTQAYAFMVLAVMAASSPERDEDHYAYNMGETINTDGIPDILREAKHGADFFLRAYRFANGIIDNMAVSVGNFGADHGWWGRPENQDALPTTLTGRGGPHERDIRLGELGSNISGQIAAGLAILSKEYATYDKPFADSCLVVAEKMYDFAKNLKLKEKSLGPGTYDGGKAYVHNTKADGWSSPAYNGNNESHDDLAIAAIALHFATYEKTGKMDYLNDAVEDTQIGVPQEASTGFFHGGWMAWNRDGMRKSSKNTSWANAYTYTLYGFYKMLLRDKETGLKYGIDDKTRLTYAENVALILGTNISYLSGSGSQSITIPTLNGPTPVSFGDLWYNMQTDQTWIYNRYQAGNIFEVLAYSDVTKDLEGINLPQKGMQNWNSAAMKQLGINQLNYMLGVNPWDVSFLLGVGDKNDAHPHHRASNPEGKNMPGAGYKYNPPTGALFGGVTPGTENAWSPSTLSWEDYHLSETCIDATAMFVASSAVAVREEDRNRAPSQINVEIRYVGYDSAIVKISQDMRGPAMILYSTSETGPFNIPAKDTVNSVKHEIHLTGLQNGTTYYFKVIAINIRSEAYATKWLVDSTTTPFSFTTLVSPPAPADIQNVKVCNLSSDSAEIMWYTPNGQYESKVYWDTTLTSYDKMTCPTTPRGTCDIDGNADVSGIPTSFHYVKIGKLKEKTTYYYCVESNGVQRCTDDNGMPLKFTTPVTHYDFDVSVYQYEFGGMDFLNLNLTNNEDRAFNELTLRFYVTAKPEEIEAVPGQNNQPGTCPLLVDSDICQAYDEAGFNRPCVNERGENVDDSIRYYLRHAVPVKLEDTYNPATGEYDWYIPIPLGGTTIKSSSRMRIDIGFSSGIYQNNMCETLRTPGKKRLVTGGNSPDWSWAAHKRDDDGADYDGVPAWDKDQGDFEQAPVNPYIVVYRKDEFISGFSPSYKEMTTKRAHYDMTVAFDAPFNVSNGSYVRIDTATSVMHLRGTALISESGYVNSIWVNGVALTKEQLAKAAVYNYETGKFDLDIPAKMTIGTNKVDVTVFAGPNPECAECQENGGCAFVNRTYYVQFSKGDRTQGSLLLVQKDGNSVTSPAKTDGSLQFQIQLRDKDSRNNETMPVKVFNSRTGDSIEVILRRDNEALGYFSGDWLKASSSEDAYPNIHFLGGDTIWVKYQDPADEEERDSVWFYSQPTRPDPKKALITSEVCSMTGAPVNDMSLNIEFSGSQFDGTKIILDSVMVSLDSTATFAGNSFVLTPSSTVTGATASFPLSDSLVSIANPKGNVTVYLRENGKAQTATVAITDAIKPKLVSVSILENENHENERDTLKVSFSEPINLGSKTEWPLEVYDGTSEVVQAGIRVISATSSDDGKSWLYVIEGNTNGDLIKPGFRTQIAGSFQVNDMSTNALASCEPITVTESTRPVPVHYARIFDVEGDGQPDSIYIEFVKLLRDKNIPDTIDVYWGSPAVYTPFTTPAGGWALDTVYGEKTPVAITKLDSANGTWIKGTVKKTCISFKDVTTYVTDTVFTCTYLDAEQTVVDQCTVDHIDTLSSTVSQKCDQYQTSQDSTFIPKIDTVGWDSAQTEHSAIRIAIPDGLYKNMTYGSSGGNGAILPRKGSLESLLDATRATLIDNCPPIIIKATKSSVSSYEFLEATMSEPLQSIDNPVLEYIERKRGSQEGIYLKPISVTTKNETKETFGYTDESEGAVRVGDFIRLVPLKELSRYKDKAGNYPTIKNPWVIVGGDAAEKTKFKVTLASNITTPSKEMPYADVPVKEGDIFRITVKNSNGTETLLNLNDNKLSATAIVLDTNTYKHAGPQFFVDITMPSALQTDDFGKPIFDFDIRFTMNVYDNLGQFIANQDIRIDLDDIGRDKISEDGVLHLNLEWLAPNGSPASKTGRRLGTGAYIAKFDFESKATYVAESGSGDDLDYEKGDVIKANDNTTKTFGFKRAKK